MKYLAYIKINFTGRTINDNDPSYGFYTEKEFSNLKKARKQLTQWKRTLWMHSGYCKVGIDIVEDDDSEPIYFRQFGKSL